MVSYLDLTYPEFPFISSVFTHRLPVLIVASMSEMAVPHHGAGIRDHVIAYSICLTVGLITRPCILPKTRFSTPKNIPH